MATTFPIYLSATPLVATVSDDNTTLLAAPYDPSNIKQQFSYQNASVIPQAAPTLVLDVSNGNTNTFAEGQVVGLYEKKGDGSDNQQFIQIDNGQIAPISNESLRVGIGAVGLVNASKNNFDKVTITNRGGTPYCISYQTVDPGKSVDLVVPKGSTIRAFDPNSSVIAPVDADTANANGPVELRPKLSVTITNSSQGTAKLNVDDAVISISPTDSVTKDFYSGSKLSATDSANTPLFFVDEESGEWSTVVTVTKSGTYKIETVYHIYFLDATNGTKPVFVQVNSQATQVDGVKEITAPIGTTYTAYVGSNTNDNQLAITNTRTGEAVYSLTVRDDQQRVAFNLEVVKLVGVDVVNNTKDVLTLSLQSNPTYSPYTIALGATLHITVKPGAVLIPHGLHVTPTQYLVDGTQGAVNAIFKSEGVDIKVVNNDTSVVTVSEQGFETNKITLAVGETNTITAPKGAKLTFQNATGEIEPLSYTVKDAETVALPYAFGGASTILTGEDVKYIANIQEWLPNKRFEFVYRGSSGPWNYADYIAKAGSVGPNLILLKTNAGHIVGGYATLGWNPSYGGGYLADPSAFIFNLKNLVSLPPSKFLPTAGQNATWRGAGYFFCWGTSDLFLQEKTNGVSNFPTSYHDPNTRFTTSTQFVGGSTFIPLEFEIYAVKDI